MLNSKNITWGWFSGKWICSLTNHTRFGGWNSHDYYPDDEPFQYYNSTANPHHLPPISISMIGHTDQANHQYDLSAFWNAATFGNLPAISALASCIRLNNFKRH